MFFHQKELIQPVKVGKPDARFGTFLLEQFGGATGELTAALQYWVQSFHIENTGIRDMLQDIAMEEFGHLEMVGKLIAQHTSKIDQTPVYDTPPINPDDDAVARPKARRSPARSGTDPLARASGGLVKSGMVVASAAAIFVGVPRGRVRWLDQKLDP